MRQRTLLIGLISLSIAHSFVYQLLLSTDSVSIVLDNQWKRTTVSDDIHPYPCWIVHSKKVYRLPIIGREIAENDLLSASLMVDEYQVPSDIPTEVLFDRLIEHSCNAPFLVLKAVRAAFHTEQGSCNDLDVKLEHVATLPIDSYSFSVYHIGMTLKYDEKEKQSWEVRCLVGSIKDRLIVVCFSKEGAWNAQMEQEWSEILKRLHPKSRASPQ